MTSATLIVLSALLMMGRHPAGAGDENDPEVVDPCNDGYVVVNDEAAVGPLPAMNLRAAWFRGVWEPGGGSGYRLAALEVTLRVCGRLDLVPPTRPPEVVYAVAWDNGECRESIRMIRASDDPDRVDVRRRCGDAQAVRARLPEGDVRIAGDRLIATLRVDGPAATVTEALVEGAVLAQPQAFSWFALGEHGDGADATLEGDTSPVGRAFTIGQDKPA